MRIACLPWYDLPETRPAQDALWRVLARHLRRNGLRDVPRRLSRCSSVFRLLCDPNLLLGQCCGYDVIYGMSSNLWPVATPRYAAPGCTGADYRSLVLVRNDSDAAELRDLRRKVCVVNGFASHSGTNALRALVAPLSRDGRFFRHVLISGGHLASLAQLRMGAADVMAIDCVLFALLLRHRPHVVEGTRVLCSSPPAPAPPLVASSQAGRSEVRRIRNALAGALEDPAGRDAAAELLLHGFEELPLPSYARIVELEAAALRHGYFELHATTPAVRPAVRFRAASQDDEMEVRP